MATRRTDESSAICGCVHMSRSFLSVGLGFHLLGVSGSVGLGLVDVYIYMIIWSMWLFL